MIKRAHRKSSLHGYASHQLKYKNEEKNVKDVYRGIDSDKSYEWVKTNISSCENESLPIRSPRSYKFGDSFFSIGAELNTTDKCKEALNENLDCVMSRLNSQETAVKDTVEEKASSSSVRGSNQGASFLSNPSSASLLECRSNEKISEKSPPMTHNGLTHNSYTKTKPSQHQFNQLSCDVQQKKSDFNRLKKVVDENKKIDTKSLESPGEPSEWMSACKTNRKYHQLTEFSGGNITSALKDVNIHSGKEQSVKDYVDSSKRVMKTPSISIYISDCDTEGSEGISHEVICSMNLEKLDDKEDRLSQLDEINVSAIKIEELNLPGLKLAQIVTEKLPLSFIHNLPQPSGLGRHSYSCPSQFRRRNTKGKREAVKGGRDNLDSSSGKEKWENDDEVSKKARSNYQSFVAEELIRQNTKYQHPRNVINLESIAPMNRSVWDVKDGVSSGNYSALSDSSLSIFSVHSSDISFSCPCSTSISHCSMPEEIPCESLPYLLLQHLSLGKKVKNDSMKSGNIGMNNFTGNKSTLAASFGNGAENRGNDSGETKLNVHEKESKLDELQRKVTTEMIVADQVSKALHLCNSSVFSGSSEQVEGERLLLLSTVRKQAALDEIRQLKAQDITECGQSECIEVTIGDIKLLLRDDFMDMLAASKQQDNFHFLCLVSYKNIVLCTQSLPAKIGQSTINFQSKNIKIACEWLDELWISFRVYMLQAKQNKSDKTKGKLHKKSSETCQPKHVTTKHDQRCLFSCGLVRSEKHMEKSKNINEQFQTRVPGFIFIARAELHLPDDIGENYFTFQQYEKSSSVRGFIQPLHEAAHFKISCAFLPRKLDGQMDKLLTQYKGFLTQFVMINDIGAWQRGWWCLKGSYFMNWKYPEDEDKYPPLTILDLKLCMEEISPVSKLKCARSNTLLIKMKVEQQSSSEGTETSNPISIHVPAPENITEHILSADTRGERDDWCKKLNGILMSLQSWKFINLMHKT